MGETTTTETTLPAGAVVQLADGMTLNLANITNDNYTQYLDLNSLTPTEKQQYEAVKALVLDYEQTTSLTPTQIGYLTSKMLDALPGYFKLLKQGDEALKTALENGTDEGLQLLHRLAEDNPELKNSLQTLSKNPIINHMRATELLGKTVTASVVEGRNILGDIKSLPATVKALATMVRDAFQGGASEDQAGAFATAFILAVREATRRNEAAPSLAYRTAGWTDKAAAAIEAAWVSFAPDILKQAYSFIANGISGKGWSWQEAEATMDAAKDKHAKAMQGNTGFNATYDYLLTQGRARTETVNQTSAFAILAATETIAGVPTEALAALVTRGGTYLNQKGQEMRLAPISKTPSLTTVPTGMDRLDQASRDIAERTGRPERDLKKLLNYYATTGFVIGGPLGAVAGWVIGNAVERHSAENDSRKAKKPYKEKKAKEAADGVALNVAGGQDAALPSESPFTPGVGSTPLRLASV